MKKALSLLLALSLATSASLLFAQNDEDIFDVIDDAVSADSTNFGFTDTDVVQIMDVTDTSINVVAPVVYDGNDPIIDYDLSYAGAPRADLEANGSTDQIETVQCNFSAIELQGVTEIECLLSVGTDIQPEQTYYLTIFPKKNGLLGDPSEEIMFNYEDLYNENTVDNSLPTGDTTHSSAPDMCTANISWTQDNDKVTMTWDALKTDGYIRIEARGESEGSFKTIGTTNITDEEFMFTPSQSGTYLVKLVPLDSNNMEHGNPCSQTIQLQPFTVTEINTQTGPKETLIIIGLLAVIGGYFLLRRKH